MYPTPSSGRTNIIGSDAGWLVVIPFNGGEGCGLRCEEGSGRGVRKEGGTRGGGAAWKGLDEWSSLYVGSEVAYPYGLDAETCMV